MVHLEKISGKNVWDILNLQIKDEQRGFVATNTKSIVEAYLALASGGHAYPFGIYDGDTPVGFLMIGYGTDEDWENPPAIAKDSYNLWRLMIDREYQGRGYGRAAMALALDFIRSRPCGDAKCCWLSYEPENVAAKNLYRSFGFVETGDMDEGEVIAALEL